MSVDLCARSCKVEEARARLAILYYLCGSTVAQNVQLSTVAQNVQLCVGINQRCYLCQ